MPETVTVAIALVTALVVFLAARPLGLRRIKAGRGGTADKRSDREQTIREEER